ARTACRSLSRSKASRLCFELFNRDDRPLEGFVKRLIWCLDRNRIGQDLFIGLGLALVESRNRGIEFLKRRGQVGGVRCGVVSAHRHQQREQLSAITDGINQQFQLHRMDLRTLLIWGKNTGSRAWKGDSRSEVWVIGVQDVKTTCAFVRIGWGCDPL